MKVLALTHAHLNPDGLSPVSCERADSIVGTWADKLGWDVYVVHTKDTKWRGIWPNGKGLKITILTAEAPSALVMNEPKLFSAELLAKLAAGKYASAISLAAGRFIKRIRGVFAGQGLVLPHQLALAEKWGKYLALLEDINANKYDFIFACVGYGDEYLLQTALMLSRKFGVPMVVDFRDLWSEHHDPGRLTTKQKELIRSIERKLLINTILISAPQKHMVHLLKKWSPCPVYYLSHSAYVDSSWEDGRVVSDEFTMLYAGKLYANGAGLRMLLDLIMKLSVVKLYKPFKCRFFVDDTDKLTKLASEYGISDHVVVNGWVSPSELWKNLRSAHLLLVPDPGVAENYPFIPTKTFQFAATGRKILCLQQYPNQDMREFLHDHDAGEVFTNTGEAVKWITELSFEKSQYEQLPALRDVAQRGQVAEDFGREIGKVLTHG